MGTNGWVSHGDVNFLEHGGQMVKKAYTEEEIRNFPNLSSIYSVLNYTSIPDLEGKYIGFIKLVDISDIDSEAFAAMNSLYGEIPSEDDLLACNYAAYIGLELSLDTAFNQKGMYAADEDYIITQEDAEVWFKELGIPDSFLRS